MKILIALLVSVCCLTANAQTNTEIPYKGKIYADHFYKSKWKAKVIKNDNTYEVTFSDEKGNKKEIITFSDEKLKTRNGLYTEYTNNVITTLGHFIDNKRNLEWKSFYENNSLKGIRNYKEDKLNGKYETYWEDGKIKISGAYVESKKSDKWIYTYNDGGIAGVEQYDVKGEKIEGKYFDKNGKETEEKLVFNQPGYPEGVNNFYKFVGKNLKYPPSAVRDEIEGKVKLSFNILKDGTINDIEVIESPDNDLALEALRVMAISPNWIPGVEFGEIVAGKHSIAIGFSLGKSKR